MFVRGDQIIQMHNIQMYNIQLQKHYVLDITAVISYEPVLD